MQLQTMDSGGNKALIQVPYACFHCGGRSADLSTLEEHIRIEHKKKLILNPVDGTVKGLDEPVEIEHDPEEEDSDPPQMLLEGLVEVQIKEEPEFLVPLDLSRKDNLASDSLSPDNEVWIKEEPDDETNFVPDPPERPNPLPKIRVASEAVLKSPAPPPPLLLRLQVPERPTLPPSTSRRPYERYREKILRLRLANNDTRLRPIRPLPPLIALPRVTLSSQVPPTLSSQVPPTESHSPRTPLIARPRMPVVPLWPPRQRMPNHFPQTPYLLQVPYTCYHCGGRSGDLETLKTHIETMHDLVALHKQRLAMEAKKKMLETLHENKIHKIRIPRLPKTPKEKTVKIKSVKPDKEKKVIIKIPKPFKMQERREKIESKKQAKMANMRFKCPFCPFGGNSFRGLILHASIKHEQERAQKRLEAEEKEESEKDPSSKPKPKKNFFYCLFCDYKSVQKPQLKKHMYAIHGKEKQHKCPYCDHKTAYGENMRWHVMKHRFICIQCEYRSTSRANLLEHQNKYCPIWIDGGTVKGSDPGNKVSRRGRKPSSNVSYRINSPSEIGNEWEPSVRESSDSSDPAPQVNDEFSEPGIKVKKNGEESAEFNSVSANSIACSESTTEVKSNNSETKEDSSQPIHNEPIVPLKTEAS